MKRSDIAAEIAAHPRGKVPRELRRRQVLSEARQLFVERGYHGASMDELARRVGVSKPVVYGIAGSKEQLFRDLMEMAGHDLATSVATAVRAESDLERKLRAGILAFLRFSAECRDGWAALLMMDDGPVSGELAQLRRAQVQLVAGLIAADAVGLRAAHPLIAEALAQAINGAVESVALWWQGHHQEFSAELLADLLTALLSPGLRALAPES